MMKFDFDAELIGSDGVTLPAYCEVQLPHVGGQKASIYLAVPSRHLTGEPPSNPCTLMGKSGAFSISMNGVHWRQFPVSPKGLIGLAAIDISHVSRLTLQCRSQDANREIRFHLAPISYLRSESNFVHFGDRSQSTELFSMDLPDFGETKFVSDWMTVYHRDAEIPGATVVAGFCAVAALPPDASSDIDLVVAKFRRSLEVLSVLFRQAVTLHGWTYTDGATVSTWINPLDPNVTPSAREDRGKYVVKPQVFVECATGLAHAYGKTSEETRSLVRHVLVAVNPHTKSRIGDRFLFMFSALERVIESAWKRDQTLRSPAVTDNAIAELLGQLNATVVAENGEYASEISARLEGFIKTVNSGASVRDKVSAFFRVYPAMSCADLWPILGAGKERGLRDVRHALAHGRSTFVSLDVVAVAEWHLAILLERLIFVLLGMSTPDGISPGSNMLRTGGMGWYEWGQWHPMRSKPDQSI
ncbi:hypothetical protein KIH07_00490 [Hydrogenophaga taeniospiralis]|uniref:hypothetical protein n=1 Tax=Hydrogenophaga taeniospiralis TaxID=65656 RepID=UPI001CFBA31C|nr:hypothetical protein [Hydrogenophaga taeniospiralis]MCB4362204.1 hypothetical protein [Hydrogenophaga taeniospiralis]